MLPNRNLVLVIWPIVLDGILAYIYRLTHLWSLLRLINSRSTNLIFNNTCFQFKHSVNLKILLLVNKNADFLVIIIIKCNFSITNLLQQQLKLETLFCTRLIVIDFIVIFLNVIFTLLDFLLTLLLEIISLKFL